VNNYRRWCCPNSRITAGGTLEPENRDNDRCFVDAGFTQWQQRYDD